MTNPDLSASNSSTNHNPVSILFKDTYHLVPYNSPSLLPDPFQRILKLVDVVVDNRFSLSGAIISHDADQSKISILVSNRKNYHQKYLLVHFSQVQVIVT